MNIINLFSETILITCTSNIYYITITYIYIDNEAPDNTLVEDLLTENTKLAQELQNLKKSLAVCRLIKFVITCLFILYYLLFL